MNATKIEWVKNPDGTQGYTWNPISGCLNNCSYCYARKLANTRLRDRYLANTNIAPIIGAKPGIALPTGTEAAYNNPFYPRFWEDRLQDIKEDWTTLAGRQHVKPRGIFVCDMSDLFGIGIPESWTRRVFEKIERLPQHRFYLLTKQPQNLSKFEFPDNCWVGVTITGTEYPGYSHPLGVIEAKVKYFSCEPLLAPVHFVPDKLISNGIKWVIIGSQTKPYKPPAIEWVEEIVQACDKAGVKVFLKDNLKPFIKAERTDDWYCLFRKGEGRRIYPVELRQEIPNV